MENLIIIVLSDLLNTPSHSDKTYLVCENRNKIKIKMYALPVIR